MVERERRAGGQAASRRLIVLGAVISQVLLTGGLLAWGAWLGVTATGSPPSPRYAAITVWVSDPRWHVAPALDVAQRTWMIGLSSPESASFAATDPGAEAIVVLWDAARLIDPHPIFQPLSAAAPGSYSQIQVPRGQANTYLGAGFTGPPITAQVFAVTAHDYYASGAASRSIFPVVGTAPPVLYAQTSTGWAAYVPSMGVAQSTLGDACRVSAGPLPAAIASVLKNGQRPWYGTTCPPPAPKVQLLLGANENLSSSTSPPSQVRANGDPVWLDQANSGQPLPAGYLTGFWVNVADPAIAAASQRDLLFSGVLYGIAGGLAAAWLVAGVMFVVSKTTPGGGGSQPAPPSS